MKKKITTMNSRLVIGLIMIFALFGGGKALGANEQIIGSFPAMGGGFEPFSTATLTNTTSTTLWFQNSGGALASITTSSSSVTGSTGVARTGSNFLKIPAQTSTGKYPVCPNVLSLAASTSYVVQFYYRTLTASTYIVANYADKNTGNVALSVNTGWTKAWGKFTTNATPSAALSVGFKLNLNGLPLTEFDDIVCYPGTTADETVPTTTGSVTGTAGNAVVTLSSLPSGTDVGSGMAGYLIVRSSSATAIIPNANGIYAVNNTCGTGTVVGIVNSSATSFTDDGATGKGAAPTNGSTYYYHVFAVDNAFNYSTDVVSSALSPASCTPPDSKTVSGTATICNGSSTTVTLGSSQSGVTYQLYAGASTSGDPVAGNGSDLTWNVSPATTTTYTVKTTSAGGYCETTMSGSAVITVNQPVNITASSLGTATYTQGDTPTNLSVTADNAAGYQWYSSTDAATNTPGDDVAVSTSASFAPSTAAVVTLYYYCVISGTSPCGSQTSSVSGAIIVNAASSPTFITGSLTGFGNVAVNSTGGPNSFTIDGTNLTTADVTVAALAGFTYSTTPGGTYTSSLSIGQSGGTFSQTVYVKFSPTAIQSYDGNIVVGGGGATSKNVSATGIGIAITPPTLTAAGSATVDADFNITFTDHGSYYSSITAVKYGSNTLPAEAWSATSGVLTLKPSQSAYLQTAGTQTVTVTATNYTDATVSQTIGVGAATHLVIATQPTAPATNGGNVATQPVINIKDQYNNNTGSGSVTVAINGTNAVNGGSASATATNGVATFSGLKAGTTDGSTVSSTFTFSYSGLSIESNSFTIPVFVNTAGDHWKSKASADWSSPTTWQSSADGTYWFDNTTALVPTSSAADITIVDGNTVTVTTAQTAKNLIVQSTSTGAILTISGGSLTLSSGTATINGRLNLTGGTYTTTGVTSVDGTNAYFYYSGGTISGASATKLYFKNGAAFELATDGLTIPTAAWTGNGASTCFITGVTSTAPGGRGQNFYNLIWDCANESGTAGSSGRLSINQATQLNVVSGGTFWVKNTGAGQIQLCGSSGTSLPLSGSYKQTGGLVSIWAASSGARSMSVAENVDISGGTLKISELTGTGSGALSVKGNINVSGTGAITQSATAASLTLNGTTAQTVTGLSGSGVSGNIDITVNNSAGVILGSDMTSGTLTLTSGNLTIGAHTLALNGGPIAGTLTNLITDNTSSISIGGTTSGVNIPAHITSLSNLTVTNTTGTTLQAGLAIGNALTVGAGSILKNGGFTLTNNGTATINGSFQIDEGGWATGNNFVYGSVSTLVFNNTGSSYGVASDAVYWPFANGPKNVTVGTGGITLNAWRSVDGLMQTSAGITILGGEKLTVNGQMQINSGGYISTNSPEYGAASSLIYNAGTGGYTTSLEWPSSNAPFNVEVKNATPVTLSGSRSIAGTLTLTSGSLDNSSNGLILGNGATVVAAGGTLSAVPTFGSSVNLTYNGSSVKGVEFPVANIINTMTVNNTAGITLADNRNIVNLTVNSGSSLSVSAGKQLNVSSAITNDGTLNLLSTSTDGTATVITPANISGSGTATVSQFLTGGRNWYVCSPVTGANATTVLASSTATTKPSSFVWYDETKGSSAPWTTESSTLAVGKGYIVTSSTETPSTDGVISFNGTLNTGDKTIGLSRTSGQTKEGFNLVGNPYPSYINLATLAEADTANFATSYWVRTRNSGNTAYTFDTYNFKSQEYTSNSSKTVNGLIAPMQAFWVRVKPGFTSGSLVLRNAKRSHVDVAANVFRAPAANLVLQPKMRLQVSNGTNQDETVVYANSNASNGYDDYDSQKMSNNSALVAEIYTVVDGQQLAINGLNRIQSDTEVHLGFTTLTSGNFSIKASELINFDGVQVILHDNLLGVQTEMTTGSEYTFTSDATTTESRFTVVFRSSSSATGLNNTSLTNVHVYCNQNGQITISNTVGFSGNDFVSVYNSVGQKLTSAQLVRSTTVLNNQFTSGVYLVTLNVNGEKRTEKVVVK